MADNILGALCGVALSVWAHTTPGGQLLVACVGGLLLGWSITGLFYAMRQR